MKRLALLGSTGSIGKQTLEILSSYPEEGEVVAIASYGRNLSLVQEQIRKFRVRYVVIFDEKQAKQLRSMCSEDVVILSGQSGLEEICCLPEVDHLVCGSSGIFALQPILKGIQCGKHLILANKELLVVAGHLITSLCKKYQVNIFPIDSEHSAIFQALEGRSTTDVSRILLTASGGPFYHYTEDQLLHVRVEDVLRHPVWSMGAKVTVDSSTLINKGLELMEAKWLFPYEAMQLDAVAHPQGLVHGIVEFCDGITIMVANPPSMLYPIQYALTWPRRLPVHRPYIDWTQQQDMEFAPIDERRFPGFALAKQVMLIGGSAPCYFNAANDILVQRFLNKEITWMEIVLKLEGIMEKYVFSSSDSMDELLSIDQEVREVARNF